MKPSKLKKSTSSLKGKKVLITAGPTREFFDPVRFLSNPSSGKMGYAIAKEAVRRGAQVTLISGPVSLPPPKGARYFSVISALEMYQAVMPEAQRSEILIMCAAVSDYRPERRAKKKIKKTGRSATIRLIPNPDILMELGKRKCPGQVLVGFAAETNHVEKHALKKLRRKNLDVIVANQVGQKRGGFEDSMNCVLFLTSTGKRKKFPLMSKEKIARNLLKFLTMLLDDCNSGGDPALPLKPPSG